MVFFKDKMKNRKAVSVRDGYQEYLGVEIGLEPKNKIFKIYRSRKTIEEVSRKLNGLAVTDGHIELKDNIDNSLIIGKVSNSKLIDDKDENTDTTVSIENTITFNDKVIEYEELSLGYFAELKKHNIYDFEQVDIVPHHLAVVEAGRCGDKCKFKDEGTGMEELLKVWDKLTLIQKSDFLAKHQPKKDEEAVKEEPKKEMKDTAEFKLAVQSAKSEALSDFKDSDEFKTIVKAEANARAEVIEKAKNFLDSKYNFADADTVKIMRDAVATMHGDEFKDNEIPTAFKMLKKTEQYKEFGDANLSGWDKIAEEEI